MDGGVRTDRMIRRNRSGPNGFKGIKKGLKASEGVQIGPKGSEGVLKGSKRSEGSYFSFS